MNRGLTTNELKIIAIVSMIIDHIGYYFEYTMDYSTYLAFRIIGRIAMPIFVFLIVQGYFHTRNIKKYILRLFLLSVITQIVISLLGFINIKYFPNYTIEIYKELNIVFSLALSLVIIYLIDNMLKRNIKAIKLLFNMIIILILLAFTYLIPLDYGIYVPIIAIFIYIAEKIKLIENNKKIIANLSNIIIALTLLVVSVIRIKLNFINLFMILSIPFILLYNKKLGNSSKKLRNLFYYVFPAQHAVLYFFAIIFYYNKLYL